MQWNSRYKSPSELDLLICLEGGILASLDHRDTVATNNPLLPVLAQLRLPCIHLALPELARSHVRVEVPVALQLRDGVGDDVVDLLQLVAVGLGVEEDSAVGEAVELPEDDVKGREVVEPFLQDVIGLFEDGGVNKGEAEIDVGLPAGEGGVVLLPDGLDLLVVVLHCEGERGVGHQLDVLDCLHGLRIWVYRLFLLQHGSKGHCLPITEQRGIKERSTAIQEGCVLLLNPAVVNIGCQLLKYVFDTAKLQD